MPLLASNLRKSWTDPAGAERSVIDIERLEIADGEHVALTGASGSGKTTLLHLLAGILAPDSGAITYELGTASVDITGLSESRRDVFRGRHIGCIFQSHHLLPAFTALENVLLGMSFSGRRADRQWARHLLAEVGLSDREHDRPRRLSVGQQQRVAVARAMANRPRVVLADEPTGALDPDAAQATLDLIRSLCVEAGASLLLVSHDRRITGQLPRCLDLSEVNRSAKGATA